MYRRFLFLCVFLVVTSGSAWTQERVEIERLALGGGDLVVDVGYERGRVDNGNFEFVEMFRLAQPAPFVWAELEQTVRVGLAEQRNRIAQNNTLGKIRDIGSEIEVLYAGERACRPDEAPANDFVPVPIAYASAARAFDTSREFRVRRLSRPVSPSDVLYASGKSLLTSSKDTLTAAKVALEVADKKLMDPSYVVERLSTIALVRLVGKEYGIIFNGRGQPIRGRNFWVIGLVDRPKKVLLEELKGQHGGKRQSALYRVISRSVMGLYTSGQFAVKITPGTLYVDGFTCVTTGVMPPQIPTATPTATPSPTPQTPTPTVVPGVTNTPEPQLTPVPVASVTTKACAASATAPCS